MTIASPLTFTSLSDNIASIVAFFQTHVTKETVGGMRKFANDLFDFVISADASCDFIFSRRLLNAVEQLPRMLAVDGVLSQQTHIELLKAMNTHFGGVITFALANSIQVAPEFKDVADIFLGVTVPIDAVFAPATDMGQFINPTGFISGDSIDSAKYPEEDCFFEADMDLGSSSADYTIRMTTANGVVVETVVTVPGNTVQGAQFPIASPTKFVSVASLVLASGGNLGDSLTVKSFRLRPLPFQP